MKNAFMRKGFTLAETMLVVVILGIIAVLVVPQLIRRQVEVSNRTKLKKAMAAYDYLMNKMILENDLHSNTSLKIWGNNCSNSANYFKISQETSNPCVFKTTDGVWWDITNIQQPMVAFNQDDLNAETAKATDNNKAFYFVAHYDDEGIIRISDNAYEVQRLSNMPDDEVTDGDKAMAKLFGFVKNKKEAITCTSPKCINREKYKTECENSDEYESGLCTHCTSCYTNSRTSRGYLSYYDENGNVTYHAYNCDVSGENCGNIDVYEYNELGQKTLYKTNCDNNGENCRNRIAIEYKNLENSGTKEIFKYDDCYDPQGNSCEHHVEVYEYDAYHNQTAHKWNCNETGENCENCNGSCGNNEYVTGYSTEYATN